MNEEKSSSSNKELLDKLLAFAVASTRFAASLSKSKSGSILAQPLVLSSVAVGRYCQEAQEASTREEFISKVNQALEKARATQYLLKVIQYGKFANGDEEKGQEDEIAMVADILEKSIKAMS